jgi:hypothetical protein
MVISQAQKLATMEKINRNRLPEEDDFGYDCVPTITDVVVVVVVVAVNADAVSAAAFVNVVKK